MGHPVYFGVGRFSFSRAPKWPPARFPVKRTVSEIFTVKVSMDCNGETVRGIKLQLALSEREFKTEFLTRLNM